MKRIYSNVMLSVHCFVMNDRLLLVTLKREGSGMEQKKKNHLHDNRSLWAVIAIPLALIACCVLPILLSAIGLTAAGTYLAGKQSWFLGGGIFLIGIVMLIQYLRKKSYCKTNCTCKESNRL